MTSFERLRETEAELVRVVRNQTRVMFLPHMEAALRAYDEARVVSPNRQARRAQANGSRRTEAQLRADARGPYPK